MGANFVSDPKRDMVHIGSFQAAEIVYLFSSATEVNLHSCSRWAEAAAVRANEFWQGTVALNAGSPDSRGQPVGTDSPKTVF